MELTCLALYSVTKCAHIFWRRQIESTKIRSMTKKEEQPSMCLRKEWRTTQSPPWHLVRRGWSRQNRKLQSPRVSQTTPWSTHDSPNQQLQIHKSSKLKKRRIKEKTVCAPSHPFRHQAQEVVSLRACTMMLSYECHNKRLSSLN